MNAVFTQADALATAQFTVNLQVNAASIADMQLALQPQAEGYELAGSGRVDFSDANTPFEDFLAKPLPVSSVALQLAINADIADEIFADPARAINLTILPGSNALVRPGLAADLGELAVTIPNNASLQLTPGASFGITGSFAVELAGVWREQALQSAMVLTPSACEPGLSCSLDFDGTANLARYTVAEADPAKTITIDRPEFTGNGNVMINGDSIDAILNSGSRLGSASVTGPSYGADSLDVVLDSALDVSSAGGQPIEIDAEQLSISLARLQVGEYQADAAVSVRELEVVADEDITAQMKVQTAGLAITGPQWIPSIGLDADVSVDGPMITFSTPLLLPAAPADARLHTSGLYDFAAGSGAINLQLPALTLTGPGASLSSYLGGWPFPADVMTGTIEVDLDVQLQPDATVPSNNNLKVTATTRIALTELAGFYAENFFRGLNTTLDLAYDSTAPELPVTTPPSSLTLDELNVGLAITDVALDYQLDGNAGIVNINSISAALLDGTVSGVNNIYDFTTESNEMTFKFSMLNLERMMELSEYKGVEARGSVSGEIPIIIRDGKVEVGAGTLYADAPGGSIRYLDAPPAGQGNPAMDLVNQALSNYQFHSLESSIDYSPEGELLLGMKLRGRNPDMNGGQEINLNLNISDNIPSLLRSLRAGRAIEDFLQEQYK